jgi:hypothetical protein
MRERNARTKGIAQKGGRRRVEEKLKNASRDVNEADKEITKCCVV